MTHWKPETKALSIRIKPETYEAIYTLSFVRRQSMNAVINDLLDEATKKASGPAVESKPDASDSE